MFLWIHFFSPCCLILFFFFLSTVASFFSSLKSVFDFFTLLLLFLFCLFNKSSKIWLPFAWRYCAVRRPASSRSGAGRAQGSPHPSVFTVFGAKVGGRVWPEPFLPWGTDKGYKKYNSSTESPRDKWNWLNLNLKLTISDHTRLCIEMPCVCWVRWVLNQDSTRVSQANMEPIRLNQVQDN